MGIVGIECNSNKWLGVKSFGFCGLFEIIVIGWLFIMFFILYIKVIMFLLFIFWELCEVFFELGECNVFKCCCNGNWKVD